MIFKNRTHAGQLLAQELLQLKNTDNIIVLGLPRGGVVVAEEIAKTLCAPLDVVICRKIGAPENEEFAIGAISESGGEYMNHDALSAYHIDLQHMRATIKREEEKIRLYQKEFRGGKPLPSLHNKTVIIADDGAATGLTAKAAIDAVRKQNPAKIIIALPVSPQETKKELQALADETVILQTPFFFRAVGEFYEEFNQVESAEVIITLKKYK